MRLFWSVGTGVLVLLVVATLGFSQAASAADAAFSAFLPRFEDGIRGFINGDPTLWKEQASHRDDVTIMGAWGAYEKGWSQAAERYDWAAARFEKSGASPTIEYLELRPER